MRKTAALPDPEIREGGGRFAERERAGTVLTGAVAIPAGISHLGIWRFPERGNRLAPPHPLRLPARLHYHMVWGTGTQAAFVAVRVTPCQVVPEVTLPPPDGQV
jgi:hypothetical protein